MQRNRIAAALLDLVDAVEREAAHRATPVSAASVMFEPPQDARLEKIFGVSHLKSISWLSRGLQAGASVCWVVTPGGVGTGFLAWRAGGS